jgi:hypothetical protein
MTPNLLMLLLGVALVFGAGFASGWHWARRATGYMLGGKL